MQIMSEGQRANIETQCHDRDATEPGEVAA